jgi:hypothetical protein
MRRQRIPAAVVVVAIFHFLFGGLGLLTSVGRGVFLLAAGGDMPSFSFTPEMKEQMEITQRLLHERAPFLKVYHVETFLVGLVISLVLIAAGVGLLRLRPWARLLSLVYAPLSIAQTLLWVYVTLAYVNPATQDAVRQTHFQSPQQAQVAQATASMPIRFLILVALLQLAYPAAVVIILLLPSVAAAFGGAAVADDRDPAPSVEDQGPDDRLQTGPR